MTYDIAVIGGGIAGVMAAVSAARLGAAVILIERYGFLGGTLTACGTGPMMTFHAGEKQVIQGITGELIERLQEKGYSPGHIFDTTGYTYTVTPFDSEGMKAELENMALEAGVTLLYHSLLTGLEYDEKTIHAARVCHKSGMQTIHARTFVDASGDCDLTFLSGRPYTKGRRQDGKCQPVTMNIKLYNVDIPKVKDYIKTHMEEFPRLKGDASLIDKAPRLSIGGFTNTLHKAQACGDISFEREDILFFETNRPNEIILNTTRILDVDPVNPNDLTRAEIEGRRQAFEIVALLKSKITGFEQAFVEFTGPFIGIRGSRTIEARHMLSAEDILSCRRFPDTVAHGGYPIDIHPPEGCDQNMTDHSQQKWGDFYDIPLRSMIHPATRNLITAGRCIGADFEAQAAIRVSPIAGAIGHAAGAAAALSVMQQKDINCLDMEVLRKTLIKQGAYLL